MPHPLSDTATLRFALERPLMEGRQPSVREIQISTSTFEGLKPLPRDREINPFTAEAAHRQEQDRLRLAAELGRRIAGEILSILQEFDTVNGYEPGHPMNPLKNQRNPYPGHPPDCDCLHCEGEIPY